MNQIIKLAVCCFVLFHLTARAEDEILLGPLTAEFINQFRQDTLKFHNMYRAMHGQAGLTIYATMNELAQAEALRLFNLKRLDMDNRSLKKFGRNYARAKNTEYTGADFTDMLYASGSGYNFTSNAMGNAGTFTQMVWRETTQIGVGVAGDRKDEIYVVMLYSPTGNMAGAFIKNVFPAVSPIF